MSEEEEGEVTWIDKNGKFWSLEKDKFPKTLEGSHKLIWAAHIRRRELEEIIEVKKKEAKARYDKNYRKAKKEERAKWRKEGERRAKIRATWARKYVKNYDAHVKAYTDAKAYDKATIELNAYYEENRKRYLEVIGARLKLGLGTIKKPYPEK